MKEGIPSGTAISSAVMRAVHQIRDAEPKILTDNVSVGLVEGSTEEEILAQDKSLHDPFIALRAGLVLSSRFAEDQLEIAVAAGIEQYVILGAGLDTFAFRQPAWARTIRIIEIDHPPSQEYKRERLAAKGIHIPNNVELCPIDFEHTTLSDGLAVVTFDFSRPSFFSWLSVTQYLTESSIEATLRFILIMPSPTQIVFTFVPPDECLAPYTLPSLQFIADMAAAVGEPWITRFRPEHWKDWLLKLGFSSVFHLTPQLANDRYFMGRTDGLQASEDAQLIHATV
jgi:methyltransferase (TIGR00027 family)